MDFTIDEGGVDGGRICANSPKIPSLKLAWYVVREPQGYRMLAAGPSDCNLGAEAIRQCDANNLKIARRWLDWACKDKVKPSLFNPFSASAFAHLWAATDRQDPAGVRLAAAALLAEAAQPAAAVPILLKARNATAKADVQLQIDRALGGAYCRLRRGPELLEVASRLLDGHRDQTEVLLFEVVGLHALQRHEELRQFVRRSLEKLAADPGDQETFAGYACELGEFGTAADILRGRARRGRITPLHINSLALNAALEEPLAADAIDEVLAADRRAFAAACSTR